MNQLIQSTGAEPIRHVVAFHLKLAHALAMANASDLLTNAADVFCSAVFLGHFKILQ